MQPQQHSPAPAALLQLLCSSCEVKAWLLLACLVSLGLTTASIQLKLSTRVTSSDHPCTQGSLQHVQQLVLARNGPHCSSASSWHNPVSPTVCHA